MARLTVFHLLASDEDRVGGVGLGTGPSHTVCNRYVGWDKAVQSWHDIYPESRCRQCENPGKRNRRVLAETEG